MVTRYPTSTVAQQDIRIGELEVDLATWRERINAVLALHAPCHEPGEEMSPMCSHTKSGQARCSLDAVVYPCPTVKTLRGES